MSDAAVRLDSVSHSYPGGRPSLADVTLDITSGEAVGVIGANGAGKTTLLHCLAAILEPTGSITVLGQRIVAGDLTGAGRLVGLAFQDPRDQLFCASVEDEVAFGPHNAGLPVDEVARRVDAALVAVDLAGMRARAPLGLSLGEQKRLALAAVLAMEPPVLALDEPTAFLDPASRRRLIATLRACARTVVLAAHDLDLVLETCDRTIILDRGRVVTDGATWDVLTDRALLASHGLEPPLGVIGPPAGRPPRRPGAGPPSPDQDALRQARDPLQPVE